MILARTSQTPHEIFNLFIVQPIVPIFPKLPPAAMRTVKTRRGHRVSKSERTALHPVPRASERKVLTVNALWCSHIDSPDIAAKTMSTAQRRNTSEMVESLGEWDHKVSDPLAPVEPSPPAQHPTTSLREAVVAAEHKVEGVLKSMIEAPKQAPVKRQTTGDMVEALGEWDHGVCDPEIKPKTSRNTGLKEAVLSAERTFDGAVRKMVQKGARAVKLDDNTKLEVSGHTEEEVAGMKLCVKDVVHQESFEAQS